MKKILLMSPKNIFYLVSLLLMLAPASISPRMQYSVRSTETATAMVAPSPITAYLDQNFTINVVVSNVIDLYAWEFKLNWSVSLLNVISVIEEPFLKSGGTTFFLYDVNATAGSVIADCTLLGTVPGVNGDGTLATITFHVKSVGNGLFDLYDVILLNSFEQLVPSEDIDGYGHFIIGHDVAITNVSISPTAVLSGQNVSIIVGTQNEGTFTENFNVTVYANSVAIGMQTISLASNSSEIVPFIWGTSGYGKGDYTVSAVASIVQNETDTVDNTRVANDTVTILYLGHDVAVIYVEALRKAIGQGYNMSIAVVVKNYGIFEEVFNTTVYIDVIAIQTQTTSLTSGSNTRLTFVWNTSDFAKGNYTISAYAWPVPDETNLVDNNYPDGWMLITKAGDLGGGIPPTFFDFDGKIDGKDLALFLQCFKISAPLEAIYLGDLGSGTPPQFFRPDGKVDGKDLALFLRCFKKLGP